MSEEIQVTVEADRGIKNQWAKGLFYRQDGKKKTLVPKRLLRAGLPLSVVLILVLLVQGTPEPVSKKSSAGSISSPDTLQAGSIQNIPAVAQGEGRLDPVFSLTSQSGQPGAKGVGDKDKKAFLGPKLIRRPRSGKIPPGSFLKAKLLSGASNGPVRAEVTDGLTVNGETLIEPGSILLGAGQSGEDRLAIRFSQIVYRDGAFDSIDAQACNVEDKIPGLKGSKVGSQALKLATGMGLNFVGGMTATLQDREGQSGTVVTRPTLKNAMLGGAATAALDQSREMMSNLRNNPPAIEVPAGTLIYILVQGN